MVYDYVQCKWQCHFKFDIKKYKNIIFKTISNANANVDVKFSTEKGKDTIFDI